MVRCIDCEKTLVVINEKGGLEGYVCEANPKLSSAFHFLEIPRNELSKKIDCNLFTPLISTRTLTENEMLAHNKKISGIRHERKIQENKKPVQMETKKCNRCGKSMNKMNRFWVCFHCRKTVPVEFLKGCDGFSESIPKLTIVFLNEHPWGFFNRLCESERTSCCSSFTNVGFAGN